MKINDGNDENVYLSRKYSRTIMEETIIMKEDPFYSGIISEDRIELLFVDREEHVNYAEKIIREPRKVCVGIMGSTGVGKSSMLSAVSACGKKQNKNTVKMNIETYTEGETKGADVGDLILIDNVNHMDDVNVISVYQKIVADVEQGKKVFFCDILQRDEKAVRARDFVLTHPSILLSMETPENLKDFLRERMKRCGWKYNFSDQSIKLSAIRSQGNLREFFRYCGAAHTLLKEQSQIISLETMKESIWKIDLPTLLSLDELSRKILQIVTQKEYLPVMSILAEAREDNDSRGVSHKLFYEKLAVLRSFGLIFGERRGKEVRYRSIYNKLDMEAYTKQLALSEQSG